MESFENLYPFQSQFLQLGGSRYHYVDEGEGDPILFVHGNPTWSFYYRNLLRGFQDGHRVVAVDHMGCGLSDKPQEYHYTLEQHIQNLERLVLDLDLRNITLVVHDWGGPIGFGVACRHPDRFSRFVIFNSAAFLSRHMPWQLNLCRIPVVGEFLIRHLNAFAALALLMAPHHRDRMTPAVREGYLAPYDSVENRIATHRFVVDIPMEPKDPSFKVLAKIQEGLGQFRDRPILIIWGARDFVFTDHFLQRWVNIFPRAEVWKLQEAGHYVVEDAPEAILRWMKEFLST